MTKITCQVFLIALFLFIFGFSPKAMALSGSAFNPGRIIDDVVFYNSNAMTPNQIQQFLNSKVPTCDTNGTKPSEFGGGTRAQWAASISKPFYPPFICLKEYSQTTPSISASAHCSGIPASATAKSSAQIIYDVGVACGINPQVLLVLLQKEQALVLDEWPSPDQYTQATGFACPDSGPCDPAFSGFLNQVYYAARNYKLYRANPSSYNYIAGRNNTILWNPAIACGSSQVFIENQATAALYIYTPYRPNQAALNNLYGSGDGCSSYGNRNFWRYFNDWFGSTTGPSSAWSVEKINLFLNPEKTNPVPKNNGVYFVTPAQKIYLTIEGFNIGRDSWGSDNAYLGTYGPRDRQSLFKDTSWTSVNRLGSATETLISPNSKISFSVALTSPQTTGNYVELYSLLIEGIFWVDNTYVTLPITVVAPNPEISPDINKLSTGGILNSFDTLLSPEKNSILVLQGNGNLELYTNFNKVWESNTSNSGAIKFINQPDGNLVLYNSSNVPVWNSGTSSQNSQLRLQPDGNLVLYNSSNVPVWSSGTSSFAQEYIINQKLINNASLYPNQFLTTPNRRYVLILQPDGNLVLYDNNKPLWNSGTLGANKASYLIKQNDGNIVLYNSFAKAVWSSNSFGHTDSNLEIQEDGNLVLYNSSRTPVWSSGTFR